MWIAPKISTSWGGEAVLWFSGNGKGNHGSMLPSLTGYCLEWVQIWPYVVVTQLTGQVWWSQIKCTRPDSQVTDSSPRISHKCLVISSPLLLCSIWCSWDCHFLHFSPYADVLARLIGKLRNIDTWPLLWSGVECSLLRRLVFRSFHSFRYTHTPVVVVVVVWWAPCPPTTSSLMVLLLRAVGTAEWLSKVRCLKKQRP